jgi:hypothetical protein
MRIETDCTHPTSTPRAAEPETLSPASRKRAPNAFKDAFLVEARSLGDPDTTSQALLAGPGEVEPVERPSGTRWAVTRRGDGLAEGGGACAACLERATALRLASILPALGTPNPFHVGRHEKRRGYALHRDRRFLAHLTHGELALAAHLHVAYSYATNLDALALLLESIGCEALVLLGRLIARRIERAQATG